MAQGARQTQHTSSSASSAPLQQIEPGLAISCPPATAPILPSPAVAKPQQPAPPHVEFGQPDHPRPLMPSMAQPPLQQPESQSPVEQQRCFKAHPMEMHLQPMAQGARQAQYTSSSVSSVAKPPPQLPTPPLAVAKPPPPQMPTPPLAVAKPPLQFGWRPQAELEPPAQRPQPVQGVAQASLRQPADVALLDNLDTLDDLGDLDDLSLQAWSTPADGGLVDTVVEEYTPDAEGEEQHQFGDDSDVSDHAVEDRAVNSEAEEVAFMRKVRAVRRKTAAQKQLGQGSARHRHDRFITRANDSRANDVVFQAFRRTVLDQMLPRTHYVTHESYMASHICQFDSETRDFVSYHRSLALGAQHEVLSRLADGSSFSMMLTSVLPDSDGLGEPISPELFAQRWNSDASLLLKHVMQSAFGEIAEVSGEWVPCEGRVCPELYHKQFALSPKGRQDGIVSAHGDIKGGKGVKEGQSNRIVSFADIPAGYTFKVRNARVTSLAEMFLSLGDNFSAANILAVYCSLPLLAVRSLHSWSSAHRQAAAKMRYEETGRYGFGPRTSLGFRPRRPTGGSPLGG